MKGLELENKRESWSSSQLVFNDVTGNLRRQRERETHRLLLNPRLWRKIVRQGQFLLGSCLGRSLFLPKETRQEKGCGRNALGRSKTSASAEHHRHQTKGCQAHNLWTYLHKRTIYRRVARAIDYSASRWLKRAWSKAATRFIKVFATIWFSVGCEMTSSALETNSTIFTNLQVAYQTSKKDFENHGTNFDTAWEFARAAFDWADFSNSDDHRAAIALEGISAARHALKLKSDLAPAHYYLALNLSQLARTKSLGGLKLVREMETELLSTLHLDGSFDFAGPDRVLGTLYLEAPGWPVSIGSRSKARSHLEKSIERKPLYPENRLAWIEACIKWGDKAAIKVEAKRYSEALAKARQEFTGQAWAASWADWDRRWVIIQKKAGHLNNSAAP